MTPPTTRTLFLRKLMDVGFTYDEAVKAYNAFTSTIAEGIINGSKVYLGQVGCLNPTIQPPRQVHMGFERKSDNRVVKKSREYILDSRLKYKFRLFKGFTDAHELRWFGR